MASEIVETEQVSSMIPSTRPTVSPVVRIVFFWNMFCFARFFGKWGHVRTDNMCENNDHYRPWLWVGRVDQFCNHATNCHRSKSNHICASSVSTRNKTAKRILRHTIKVKLNLDFELNAKISMSQFVMILKCILVSNLNFQKAHSLFSLFAILKSE